MVPRPAPIAGWNARDQESAMASSYAITLDNFFPGTADLRIRKGWVNHVTGIASAVLSIFHYSSTTAQKLFCCTATNIYDASVAGAVGASVKAITNGNLKTINMNSLGGSYLFCVNGTDDLIRYDGTTWLSINAVSTPAITGKATNTFSHITAHKRRLYFVEKNSMSFWYLPVNTIAGAVVEFPMGQLFTLGGKLVQMGTWTLDGGSGIDDYAVFITSEGEIAIYKGSDPGDANNWSLVGVYFVGKPVGTDCFKKYEGDVLVLTQTGVYPLSKSLLSTSVEKVIAFSDTIQNAFQLAYQNYGTNTGWSMTVFQDAPFLLVNIPTVQSLSSEQYVMNSTTKAWCKFTGMNGFCWEVFNNNIYYGGLGGVFKAWTGYNDNGAQIIGNVQCAYDYLNNRKRKKMVKLVQPHLNADGDIKIELGIAIDYEPVDTRPLNYTSYVVRATPIWGTSLWGTSKWASNTNYKRDWKVVFAPEGYAISFRLRVTNNLLQVRWPATDFIYETGSIF